MAYTIITGRSSEQEPMHVLWADYSVRPQDTNDLAKELSNQLGRHISITQTGSLEEAFGLLGSEGHRLVITECILAPTEKALSATPPRVDMNAGYRLAKRAPDTTHVAFLSGPARNVLVCELAKKDGIPWIEKPIPLSEVAEKMAGFFPDLKISRGFQLINTGC